ncbi:type 2 lantipeptide synthetase LanM [Listeria sp. FSL L7-1582]|uniref:type 2 lanthipeptide synthetase LanM n=1 Tax=Listeria portnoyi TaxID=2713504 RepID=UPI00164E1FB0|nr:type 2 lanthipeptide synthetase LanM [Listeria portnoyi]MBC6308476.1 type 2 lantipeptide synthetase LanM [Listeria portnoyi]
MEIASNKLLCSIKQYYSQELSDTLQKIDRLCMEHREISNVSISLEKCLDSLLETSVWRLCHKTFVYEFHEYRKSVSIPANPLSSKAFNQFVQLIDKHTLEVWFNKYKVLKDILTKTIKNICFFMYEVCQNFFKDLDTLSSEGFISDCSKLQSVTHLDSDPHNGAKVMLCFEFQDDNKVLYKPRSVDVDIVIDKIFKKILRFSELNNYTPVPKTLPKKGYGWQKCIERHPVEHGEINNAFYNLGLTSALFSCIGTTDLHDENILFNAANPYFIDLETSLQPSASVDSTNLANELSEVLSHSIVGTSIIPAKMMSMPKSLLIGAINTPFSQETTEMIFSMKNYGTDAVDIAKEKKEIKRLTIPLTLHGGKAPNPLSYQRDFLNGYSVAYKKVISKKEEILSFIIGLNFPLRIVLRPTVQYFLMLDACLFPENLTNYVRLNKILSYMKPSRLPKEEVTSDILIEEMNILKNGDIPSFYINVDETKIEAGKFISQQAFELSPIDNLKRRLRNISEFTLLMDKRLIAEGFSEIREHISNVSGVKKIHNSPLFMETLEEMTIDNPRPLINLLLRLSISTNETDASTGWIGGIYGNIPFSYQSTSLCSFHDVGGIVFLLDHLVKFQPCHQEKKLLDSTKKGLIELEEKYFSKNVGHSQSIISGRESIEYLLNFKSDSINELEKVILDMSETTLLGDVFLGVLGIGLVYSSFEKTSFIALELVSTKIKSKDYTFEEKGIAHGELGAIWTKFRLSFKLNELEKCKQYFYEVQDIKLSHSGWCNGYAGLLMVLAEMSKKLSIDIDLGPYIEEAIKLPEKDAIDLSVCHGASGVLQSLLYVYNLFDDSDLLLLANQYWGAVLKKAKKNEFYTGEHSRDYILGYFLGWGGIADSSLLLKMCNQKKEVWFPLNLSSFSYQNEIH